MIEKKNMLAELLKYKDGIETQIKELKDKDESGESALLSSDPNEKTIKDLINSLEGTLRLIEQAIDLIKRV